MMEQWTAALDHYGVWMVVVGIPILVIQNCFIRWQNKRMLSKMSTKWGVSHMRAFAEKLYWENVKNGTPIKVPDVHDIIKEVNDDKIPTTL